MQKINFLKNISFSLIIFYSPILFELTKSIVSCIHKSFRDRVPGDLSLHRNSSLSGPDDLTHVGLRIVWIGQFSDDP